MTVAGSFSPAQTMLPAAARAGTYVGAAALKPYPFRKGVQRFGCGAIRPMPILAGMAPWVGK